MYLRSGGNRKIQPIPSLGDTSSFFSPKGGILKGVTYLQMPL
ncbi:hypothetical protein POREN0001_0194 [Porphyromonas endodontalis ATCC 35406]|uniref:Uncharacterized protein n=1 Tax=Porphyromonas endodontalis (strain ATCC 35406 / DSM 24491 / JCM 8526 / CCUG 16442 / BCRC 14492 / NCTC 13058 / HG 370) TaxID=553175 RepID=C3JAF8_POREA|nr:hypothetical protein POREN0001_0194 [Porphyromonas endodontalis ATCC 35406]